MLVTLNIVALSLGFVGAMLMFFYPPRVKRYTAEGHEEIAWIDSSSTEQSEFAARVQTWLAAIGPLLLAFGFALQLLALTLA
jgi:hypothetical protein